MWLYLSKAIPINPLFVDFLKGSMRPEGRHYSSELYQILLGIIIYALFSSSSTQENLNRNLYKKASSHDILFYTLTQDLYFDLLLQEQRYVDRYYLSSYESLSQSHYQRWSIHSADPQAQKSVLKCFDKPDPIPQQQEVHSTLIFQFRDQQTLQLVLPCMHRSL